MLKPVSVDQIGARNMEAVAVVKAPLARIARSAGWTPRSGGDDFDDFEGVALSLAGVGSVGLVSYRGQSAETSSVLAPMNLTGVRSGRLIRAVLDAAGLDRGDLEWTAPGVSLDLPPHKLAPRARPAAQASRRRAAG